MAALRDTRNPEIQNHLSYVYRNSGELPLACKHYARALQFMIGNRAKAEEHLALLERICLIACAETGVLEKKITEYDKRR